MRERVFISYSHNDKQWLDELLIQLKILEYMRVIPRPWTDRNILAGSKWEEEIDNALEEARVAILLVSPHFLASNFIMTKELPRIIGAQVAGQLTIIAVAISSSNYKYIPELQAIQWAHDPARPLDTMARGKKNQLWTQIVGQIDRAFNQSEDKHSHPSSTLTAKTGHIKILFLSADPFDISHIQCGKELREIYAALQRAKLRERFDLQQRTSVRPMDISQALLDIQPSIVHFCGHGAEDGTLCVEDEGGKAQRITPEALSSLFEQFSSTLRCVVFNACYSEKQAQAVVTHIDYVIGISQQLAESAAIAYAIGFYQALGANSTIEESHRLGLAQSRVQGASEHLLPFLFKKTNI